MRIKRILIIVSVVFPSIIFLLCGIFLISYLQEEEEDPRYQSGQGISQTVMQYTEEFSHRIEEYHLEGYEIYLYAIMMVETGGVGNDPMQSLGDVKEEDKTPALSIKTACAYFARLLEEAQASNCDIWTVIQAYNYGIGYIDYVSEHGGKHTYVLAKDFAAKKSGGKQVKYSNPIAINKNGGWRYEYGNMFYVYLVKQYLPSEPMSEDMANTILQEAYKYEGYKYVWGGSTPQTSFDCSGLVQWCYGVAGITLPRTAQEQYNATDHIDLSAAEPGDLIFFTKTYESPNLITHVGIYVGNGKMFHAGNPIGFANLNDRYYREHFVCAARVKQQEEVED